VNRAANIALAVLAVVVFSAAIYVVTHNDAPSGNNGAGVGSAAAQQTTRSTTPQSTPTSTAQSSPSLGVAGTSASTSGTLVIAFLGDDWTAGTGASSEAKRFTTLVCAQLDAEERNFGVDLTGYAKSSDSAGPYRERIDELVAADPAVVVVSGGRNDRSDDAETAAVQIHQVFAKLHAKLPNAVLIGVAPFWGDSDLPEELVALADAVKQGVTDAGGTYLDIPDPIHGHPDYMADLADPNDKGYAAIAAALEPELAPLLPA
jgi:lysophospholipase L1-like esterase